MIHQRVFPLKVKLTCDKCGKVAYLNKKYFEKFGWKHPCVPDVVEPGQVLIMEEKVAEVANDITPDESKIETEIISKKKRNK